MQKGYPDVLRKEGHPLRTAAPTAPVRGEYSEGTLPAQGVPASYREDSSLLGLGQIFKLILTANCRKNPIVVPDLIQGLRPVMI